MIQINLLPWREQLRKRKQNRFGIIAMTVAGLGLFFSYFFTCIILLKIKAQLLRNDTLQTIVNDETAHFK